jgi:hypothetical protein
MKQNKREGTRERQAGRATDPAQRSRHVRAPAPHPPLHGTRPSAQGHPTGGGAGCLDEGGVGRASASIETHTAPGREAFASHHATDPKHTKERHVKRCCLPSGAAAPPPVLRRVSRGRGAPTNAPPHKHVRRCRLAGAAGRRPFLTCGAEGQPRVASDGSGEAHVIAHRGSWAGAGGGSGGG